MSRRYILFVVMLMLFTGCTGTSPEATSGLTTGEQVSISGQFTCLPYRDPNVVQEKCAFGLRDADGKFYGLLKLNGAMLAGKTNGGTFVVTGTVIPTSNDTYDVAATLEVISIE